MDICDKDNDNDDDKDISETQTPNISETIMNTTDDSEFNVDNIDLLEVIKAVGARKHKDKNGEERILVPKHIYDLYQICKQIYQKNERTKKELLEKIIRMEQSKPFTNIIYSQNCNSNGSDDKNEIQTWKCPPNHNIPIERMDTDDYTMFDFTVNYIFICNLCQLTYINYIDPELCALKLLFVVI